MVDEWLGTTVHVPFHGNCYKIELFQGGKLFQDSGNAKCANKVFTESAVMSNFLRSEDSIAYFNDGADTVGYNGYFEIEIDPTLATGKIETLGMSMAFKYFAIKFVLPACTRQPSVAPSSQPSIAPKLCSMQQVMGKTFYFSYNNACWRMELFAGGELTADKRDRTFCGRKDFSPTAVFSLFDSVYQKGNVAVYQKVGPAGLTGTVQIKESKYASAETSRLNILSFNPTDKMFDAEVLVQSCN